MMNLKDALILGLLCGLIGLYFLYKNRARWRGKKVARRGIRGEEKARKLLEANGYKVIAHHLSDKVQMKIDGKIHENTIRADFLVRKGLKRYVAEVKTGAKAKATLPDVRRQMLEYYLIFKPSGMLFVDMEREKIQLVSFDQRTRRYYWFERLEWAMIFWLVGFISALVVLGYLM